MLNKRQAVLFGNFNSYYFINKIKEYTELITKLNLKYITKQDTQNFQLTPAGPRFMEVAALECEEKKFSISFSQLRINIEELYENGKERDIKEFVKDVLIVFEFLSNHEKMNFSRLALNGSLFPNDNQGIDYLYKKFFARHDFVEGTQSDWSIGETRRVNCKILDSIINIKYLIAKGYFFDIENSQHIPDASVQITYDINTDHLNMSERYNFNNSNELFDIFIKYSEMILAEV